MRSVIKILGIFLLTFCLHATCYAQQSIDEIVEQIMEVKHAPGLAFIVAQNGKIVEEGYYGLSNLELNVPVTEKSVFAIASMSKTYTAAAVLLLAEEKQINLNDPVNKYILEAPESWSEITILHLLTHTSGLVDDWGLYNWDKSNELFLNSQSDSLFLDNLFKTELQFKPGTSVKYSCGPFVLGVVIERVTGHYYEEYLKKVILGAMDLNETYVDHPYKIIPNRVSGYFEYDTTEINAGISGMGNGILLAPVAYGRADVGIRTTARDLLKFYNALTTGSLLNEYSMNVMFNPPRLNNGDYVSTAPGWMIWPLVGNLSVDHSGGFRTGFNSYGFVIPKDNFVVILLTNLQGSLNYTFSRQIAAKYYPELTLFSTKKPKVDNRPEVTLQHLELFKSLDSNALNDNLVNENYPTAYLSKALKKSIASAESVVFLGEDDIRDKNLELFGVKIQKLRYYKLNGSRTPYVTVSLDNDGKVVFIDHPETR